MDDGSSTVAPPMQPLNLTMNDDVGIPVADGLGFSAAAQRFGSADHNPELNVLGREAPPSPVKASRAGAAQLGEIPEEFRCMIDGRLMITPVVFVSNIVSPGTRFWYELGTLQAWAATQGDVCPVSGEAFESGSVRVDEEKKAEIEAWIGRGAGGSE